MNTIIDRHILDELTAQAEASPRLRMNHSIHQSLEDKCHRVRNAHHTKDESFLLLRGEVKVAPYNDGWSVIGGVSSSKSMTTIGWIYPKVCGIIWKRCFLTPSFMNGRRDRLCRNGDALDESIKMF